MTGDVILSVEELVTTFETESGSIRAVDRAGFELERGCTLGIVGESGCGKSVTALSIMGLLPKPSGRVESGVVAFNNQDLLAFSPGEMHRIRGKKIAMIFQEPMTALNPVHKIGKQVREVFFLHFPEMGKKAVHRACVDMLTRVGIADPGEVVHHYPHQLSGGMRQRVMIAMALAPEPDILIADEPTTALDVTVQAQILDLVKTLKADISMSVILITHDLGVIAENCDRAVVMYAGKVVETADVDDLFSFPRHPYTRGLLTSIPLSGGKPKTRLATIRGRVPSLEEMPAGCRFFARCCFARELCSRVSPEEQSAGPRHTVACHFFKELGKALVKEEDVGWTPATTGETIVAVKHLKKYFPVHGGIFLRRKGWVYAVDDVSFEVKKGETLGLVGESGCGKTTLGRCLLGLYPATAGEVFFNGTDLGRLKGEELKQLRLKMQMIFQDPFDSLNPRHTVQEILREKYAIHRMNQGNMEREIAAVLEKVGLSAGVLGKYPHEFSGGQRQRIGIARAVALEPEVIICDEPVSALDVSIQSQILNLLLMLQQEMGLTYLFISHDLAVVRHMADRIAVMYLGRIVEMADGETIYNTPGHPYTRALLSAIPHPDPRGLSQRIILYGDVPSPRNPPPGCRFHTRCKFAKEICQHEEPVLELVDRSEKQHYCACHFYP
ncbi:MAG: ABC transporter ATP-binding protein [Desulfobacteraceae bacterium]